MTYKSFMKFELSNQLVISQNEEKGQEVKVFFKRKTKEESLYFKLYLCNPGRKNVQILIKLAFQQKNPKAYHQQKYKITELERWLSG